MKTIPLWAVAQWLSNRGYRETYRTLRRKLSQPLCPIKLRTWSRKSLHPYAAIAETDLDRLLELLGPPQSQMSLPLS